MGTYLVTLELYAHRYDRVLLAEDKDLLEYFDHLADQLPDFDRLFEHAKKIYL